MGWLSGWLKELIAILLIAAFADLLLPSNAMQRYVKAVIGMFLLFVLLSPVLQLFQRNWDANKLLAAVDLLQSSSGAEAIKPLDDVMKEAEQLKADQQRQALRLIEARLSDSIKAQLAEDGIGVASSVAVQTSVDKQGKPVIEAVNVVMQRPGGQTQPGGAAGDGGKRAMEPVKPVTIDIRPQAKEAAAQTPESADAERVKRAIANAWKVTEGRVRVSFETEGKP